MGSVRRAFPRGEERGPGEHCLEAGEEDPAAAPETGQNSQLDYWSPAELHPEKTEKI